MKLLLFIRLETELGMVVVFQVHRPRSQNPFQFLYVRNEEGGNCDYSLISHFMRYGAFNQSYILFSLIMIVYYFTNLLYDQYTEQDQQKNRNKCKNVNYIIFSIPI